ncbi:hypothetical protein FJ250_12230, partial [bacterium]|nr:hypothetical protein [bacterium]
MTRIRFALLLAVALLLVVAGAVFAQPSTVSYQGQLSVSGAPFDGNAAFKFAVLCGAPGSHTSAWSNDGTSTGGSEPSAAVTLAVAQGLFSTRLGDATAGMVPLGSALIEGCANPVLRVP